MSQFAMLGVSIPCEQILVTLWVFCRFRVGSGCDMLQLEREVTARTLYAANRMNDRIIPTIVVAQRTKNSCG